MALPGAGDLVRVRAAGGAVLAALATTLLCGTGAHAEGEAPARQGPAPLIGDVIIFNDEIVEPVSLPVSTCGAVAPVLSKAPAGCKGTSRVSDDDA